jgi:hypothetical protein
VSGHRRPDDDPCLAKQIPKCSRHVAKTSADLTLKARLGTKSLKPCALECLDQLTSNVFLSIGKFALAILGGWVLSTQILSDEPNLSLEGMRLLRFVLRYVANSIIGLVVSALIR